MLEDLEIREVVLSCFQSEKKRIAFRHRENINLSLRYNGHFVGEAHPVSSQVMDVAGCRSLTLPFECPATHRLRLLCVAQTNLTPDSLRQTMGNSAADAWLCSMTP